jgi:hypothetical protein
MELNESAPRTKRMSSFAHSRSVASARMAAAVVLSPAAAMSFASYVQTFVPTRFM